MPDVADTTPPAVDQTGNLVVWWATVLGSITAPTVVDVSAATSKRITYSFVPGGWTPTQDQEILTDDRLTLVAPLQAFGKTSQDLTLQYVGSTDAGSAHVLLVEGTAGYFIERRAVPNTTLAAATQKVYIHQGTLGKQIAGPVDGTGKFTITQKFVYTGVRGGAVALV